MQIINEHGHSLPTPPHELVGIGAQHRKQTHHRPAEEFFVQVQDGRFMTGAPSEPQDGQEMRRLLQTPTTQCKQIFLAGFNRHVSEQYW